jgi:predicted nucleotide-binding protein
VPGRPAGSKNRNYPPISLKDAILVAQKIQDEASDTTVSKLALAELLGVSPASSRLRDLVASSRLYGLTTGGMNSDEFGLTVVGRDATGADEVARTAALKQAVLTVAPFKIFLEAFNGKKVPSGTVFKEILTKNAEVDADRANECMDYILADGEMVGFLRLTKGGNYVDLTGSPRGAISPSGTNNSGGNEKFQAEADEEDRLADIEGEDRIPAPLVPGATAASPARGDGPKKVFVAHGKNRVPLEQLRKALDAFKVGYAVAIDEPNKGRPISRKVAALMQEECSSGIFLFTADEQFFREKQGKPGETEEIWRPSENVIFELGAASILYENRIVIFKERDVDFPSDYKDLGYIEFENDQLGVELGALFSELVALDILEVRAKG